MTLFKTGVLNGLAVIIKMLTMLAINKILAIYVGPSGYAALGQFQNAIQVVISFASGAINTGVTKHTAEFAADKDKQISLWRTAGAIALGASLLGGVLIAVFSEQLADLLLNGSEYQSVFYWLAATLSMLSMNGLLLAILNGKKELERYIIANIAGSMFSLIVTGYLAATYGLYGALVGLVVYQSLCFFVTLSLCLKVPWFRLKYIVGPVNRAMAISLSKYAATALASAVCWPASYTLIRNFLGGDLGWEVAGYWDAMWRLSSAYLMMAVTTLSIYFLPRFSEITSRSELASEVRSGYKLILPIAIFSALAIYILRDEIILLLFTAEFIRMREFFALQLVGDTLKIGAWVLSYLMLGRGMVRLIIYTEIIFSSAFFALTVLFTAFMGFQGVAAAYAVNMAIYWATLAVLINRKLNLPES